MQDNKHGYEVVIKNLYKNYEKNNIFYGLNMEFIKGKITVVLGASGCGKTTLLNIISGMDKDYEGDVAVNSGSMSYVFQEDRLIKNLTVYENVAFVLKSHIGKKDISSIVLKCLEMVHMEQYRNKFPEELSGGMKRRVAFARAIAYNASLVLLDEPFKGLDTELKDEIMDEFLTIHRQSNNTVIVVTHDKYEAEKLGDIIYSLS
ncbi:ABC transporter ATP-binding protein [Clostridium sp.]|uniref:ABC transporter ATP-binding protein n=1 Tax=Clostridium sp. TaxID=1506 RepID=UPI003430A6B7